MALFKTPETKQSSSGRFTQTTTWGARLALLALITLLAAGLSVANGKKHKLSKDLDALKGDHNGATVDVIIQFNQKPTDVQHKNVQNKGGVLKTKLDVIKGAHYSVPAQRHLHVHSRLHSRNSQRASGFAAVGFGWHGHRSGSH